ncbi:glycosyltransferase [Clostridium butyricum]|uniref:glycosyltransferase n=1 Tax=Clostridium butyricum TaxID=1492 RepID=UPI00051C480B|nr:glycosyltransferase [Clostridium butyricum]QUF83027.1 glycosyltransferase [Clostridium butyricum]
MLVGGVTVLFNPEEDVVNNIKSYCNQIDYLYLIDNSSKDNSELFKGIGENIYYISLRNNYGIAYALNIGINSCKNVGCSWVLTMDQDSYFRENYIDNYKKIICKGDSLDNIAFLVPQFHTDRMNSNVCKEFKELKLAMQSGNLLNIDKYNDIGIYNEKLFIDCVDYDYCYRARKKGYKIIQCSDVILNHSPAITKSFELFGKKIKYGYAKPLRYYYQIRNLNYLFWEYKDIKILGILLYKWFKIIFLFDNKKKFIKAGFCGIRDFLNNNYVKKEGI